jgi:hypothetical protein
MNFQISSQHIDLRRHVVASVSCESTFLSMRLLGTGTLRSGRSGRSSQRHINHNSPLSALSRILGIQLAEFILTGAAVWKGSGNMYPSGMISGWIAWRPFRDGIPFLAFIHDTCLDGSATEHKGTFQRVQKICTGICFLHKNALREPLVFIQRVCIFLIQRFC